MTEGTIAVAIAKYYGLRSLVLVNNCIGVLTQREADLIHVTSSLYLEEIEIKISVADYKREFENQTEGKEFKHRYMRESPRSLIRRFYIAMPTEVYNKVSDTIPSHVGIFVVRETPGGNIFAVKTRTAKDFKNARKLEAKELMSIATMASSRLWSLKAGKACGRK